MPMHSDDMWTCDECGSLNPDWHTSCPLCGSYRQNIILSTASPRSNSPGSVFSENSAGTSATGLSTKNAFGFSHEQVQTATREFISIIRSDQVLKPLYETARNDPRIELTILRRYIRETLRIYAEDLKGEANDSLELSASHLVRIKAGRAARCICNDEHPENQPARDIDDNSDEETQERVVDERQFDDPVSFRSFLTQSKAFAKLRVQTELYLIIKAPTSDSDIEYEKAAKQHPGIGTLAKRLSHFLEGVADFILISLPESLQCLETPTEAGWTRIKIECHTCGERFFDDVLERREASIAQLKQCIEQTLEATITIIPSGEGDVPSSGHWHFPPLKHRIARRIKNIIRWAKSIRGPVLPEYNNPQLEDEPQSTDLALISTSWLHLLSCVHRNWEHRILLQGRVEHIKTDLELFAFLKTQVGQRRRRVMRILSCRKVQGIHFTMFKVRMGNRLEVRDHSDCCEDVCNCLPPPTRQDYDFERIDSSYPIIPPKIFAHMLKHPKMDVHQNQTHIYRWIPKLKGAALAVDPKKELAEGWGLYFEEGWDINDIMTVFGLVFIASLVFLVCWSKYTSDVSAASGVSSYMITVAGIAISLLVIRAGSM